jgi:hypothetical protein
MQENAHLALPEESHKWKEQELDSQPSNMI